HDLHDLLARGEALENLVPHGLLADALDEGPHDLEVDVGLEEGDPHLAERLLDVVLGQAAGASETVEDRLQTLRQCFEHWVLSGVAGHSEKAVKPTGHPKRRKGGARPPPASSRRGWRGPPGRGGSSCRRSECRVGTAIDFGTPLRP